VSAPGSGPTKAPPRETGHAANINTPGYPGVGARDLGA
jgi:hypothetical protein